MEPGGAEVWRLEMHDASGRTVRLGGESRPAADCVTPETCVRCGSGSLSIRPDREGLEAVCSDCGHRWDPGRLNPD
jgi:hypothetical protein